MCDFCKSLIDVSICRSKDLSDQCLVFVRDGLISLGPIPWVIISEFFTQEARPVAVGVSTVVHWFANAFIGLIFKFLLVSI